MDPTSAPPGLPGGPSAPPGAIPTPPPGMSQDQFKVLQQLSGLLGSQYSQSHDTGIRTDNPQDGMVQRSPVFGEGGNFGNAYGWPTAGPNSALQPPDFTGMLTKLFTQQNGQPASGTPGNPAGPNGEVLPTPGQPSATQGPLAALMQQAQGSNQ